MALLHQAQPFVDNFINIIFPPRCGACGAMVEEQGKLCAECWSNINFISAPFCDCCGVPFEYEVEERALCGQCIKQPPAYDKSRTVFRYETGSKRQILGLKYYDRTAMIPTFGTWLAGAGQVFIDKTDVIIPVPLHPLRLIKRKYNQASLLAYAIARETNVPVVPGGLIRTRNTVPQASLPRLKRLENLRGVFKINERCRNRIEGKSILLVDDVITTGSTIHACSTTLKRSGAKKIFVLSLARTAI